MPDLEEKAVEGNEEMQTPSAESVPAEEKAPTEPEGEPEEKPQGQVESKEKPTEDEELIGNLSEKAQRRFHKLTNRVKDLESQLYGQALKEMSPPPLAGSQQQPGETIPQPEVTGQEENYLTQDQLKKWVAEEVDKKTFFVEKGKEITSDVEYLAQKYDVLNPASPAYDDNLSKTFASAFDGLLRKDIRGARLKDFVDQMMSLRASGKEEGKSEVSAKTLEQLKEAPILPSAGEKKISSEDELINAMKNAKSEKELMEITKNFPHSE